MVQKPLGFYKSFDKNKSKIKYLIAIFIKTLLLFHTF